MTNVSELLAAAAPGISQHLRDYVASNGADGYFRDLTVMGGSPVTTHLLLRTVGRKTGKISLVPLIYMPWRDEYVIVASKGGFDAHPAWYLNLTARPEVEFQLRERKFKGVWRVAEGAERQVLWEYAKAYYPPYIDYEKNTDRVIPVVVLSATAPIEAQWSLPEGELPGAPKMG